MSDDRNEGGAQAQGEGAWAWADVTPALALLVLGLMALGVATLMSDTVPGQFLVFGPGLGRAQITDAVYRAGGGVMGLGGLPGIAIAASDDPGFRTAVLSHGARFVMASPRLLGCFTAPKGAHP